MIKSPGYGTDSGYPYNVNCQWALTGGAPLGRNMTLHFQEFELNEDENVEVGGFRLSLYSDFFFPIKPTPTPVLGVIPSGKSFFPKCMVQNSQSEKVSQSGLQLQP